MRLLRKRNIDLPLRRVIHVAHLAFDLPLHFLNQAHQVLVVQLRADEDEVNDARIAALGVVAHQVHFLEVAQFIGNAFHQLVQAHVLHHHLVEVAKERVVLVGREDLLIAFHFTLQHAGLFELIQFQANGIGTLAEFLLQATEIALAPGVQKELEEEFEAGAGRDQRFKQSLDIRYWMLDVGC